MLIYGRLFPTLLLDNLSRLFGSPSRVIFILFSSSISGEQSDAMSYADFAETTLCNYMCFHLYISPVFDKLLVPLPEPLLIMCDVAADLLAACLDIITQCKRQSKTPFLMKILQDTQARPRTALN